jgi:hypothetical protein
MKHYFAYGTLLDIDAMRRIAPSAKAVAVARLADYELAFARCADPAFGGCTLDRRADAVTWGVQYELADAEMAALDKAAGIDTGRWAHLGVRPRNAAGEEIASTTYVIANAGGPYSPPDSYVAPIFKGAEALGLPAAYRARLRDIVAAAQAGAT